jgi:hypothetical protein
LELQVKNNLVDVIMAQTMMAHVNNHQHHNNLVVADADAENRVKESLVIRERNLVVREERERDQEDDVNFLCIIIFYNNL